MAEECRDESSKGMTHARTLLGTDAGAPELDELVAAVYGFLRATIRAASLPPDTVYEVEAKLGRFVDRGTGARVSLPVATAAVLRTDGGWCVFESALAIEEHAAANRAINARFRAEPGRWTYRRERTIDTVLSSAGRRVRVSRDAATGAVTAVVDKQRVADLSIHLPAAAFDVRISVNTERTLPMESAAGNGHTQRRKDRVAYSLDGGALRIDLTQVQQDGEARHELEAEMGSPLDVSPQSSLYFVRNVLDLVRISSV